MGGCQKSVFGCVVKEIEVGVEVTFDGGLEKAHFDMIQRNCVLVEGGYYGGRIRRRCKSGVIIQYFKDGWGISA